MSVSYLGANSAQAQKAVQLVNAFFPPTIPYALASTGSAASGTFNITEYDLVDGTDYGHSEYLQAVLDGTLTNTGGQSYRCLQTIETSDPNTGHTNNLDGSDRPYIDDGPPNMGDDLPFYWDDDHESTHFLDTPTRLKPFRNKTLHWYANLFLCSYVSAPNGKMGNVVIRDGLRWGFSAAAVRDNSGGGNDAIISGDEFDGNVNRFRPEAVPEPASIVFLAIGALGVCRRRRVRVP